MVEGRESRSDKLSWSGGGTMTGTGVEDGGVASGDGGGVVVVVGGDGDVGTSIVN